MRRKKILNYFMKKSEILDLLRFMFFVKRGYGNEWEDN